MNIGSRVHLCHWSQFPVLAWSTPFVFLHQGFRNRVMLCQSTHFAKVHRPKIGHEVWDYQLSNLAGWKERECVHEKLSEVTQVFYPNFDAILIGQKLDGTLHHILVL